MRTPHVLLVLLFAISCQQNNEIVDLRATILYPIDSIPLAALSLHDLTALSIEDSSAFLLSRASKEIVKTNLRFKPLLRYGVTGFGPGEFTDPYDLSASSDRLYVIDFSQRKLMQFDHKLRPIDEFFSKFPPFSILYTKGSHAWMGTMDMEYEDVYRVDFDNKQLTLIEGSKLIKYGLEGVALHAKNDAGRIIRYRPFNRQLDLFDPSGSRITFQNLTQPERPELEPGSEAFPIFKQRIHHGAFVTGDRACVLSGDHSPQNQPVQCFDFDGKLVYAYILKQGASLISTYSDSTLYTYSPTTNHIYVYNLGF